MIALIKWKLALCRILWENRHEILNALFHQAVVVLERETFFEVALHEVIEGDLVQGNVGKA